MIANHGFRIRRLSDSHTQLPTIALRKVSPGVKVTEEEIVSILNSEVLKRDVVQGESAEEALKRVKKALKKQARKKVVKKETVPIAF